MASAPGILGAVVAVVAIVCATVAVSLGKIDAATFVAIVGAFGGVTVGAGAHASGVRQGSS